MVPVYKLLTHCTFKNVLLNDFKPNKLTPGFPGIFYFVPGQKKTLFDTFLQNHPEVSANPLQTQKT